MNIKRKNMSKSAAGTAHPSLVLQIHYQFIWQNPDLGLTKNWMGNYLKEEKVAQIKDSNTSSQISGKERMV